MESKPMMLSSKGLANMMAIPPTNKFTIRSGKKSLVCDRLVACFISPKITNLVLQDTSVNEYNIKTVDKSNNFDILEKILHGEPFTINEDNYIYLVGLGMELENKELTLLATSIDNKPINPKNVFRRLKEKHYLELSFTQEADYVASRFTSFQPGALMKLHPDILEAILESKELQINNESQLLSFIWDASDVNPECTRLVGLVMSEYVPSAEMPKFLSLAERAGLQGRVWESLRRRLLAEAVPDKEMQPQQRYLNVKKGRATKSVMYSGDAFAGIVRSIATAVGENPHTHGDVTVSASSIEFGALANVFENNGSIFGTTNSQESWMQLDFKHRRVSVSAYSLRGLGGPKFHTLKSWKLIGSVDGKEWATLDTQWDVEAINGKYHAVTFPVRPQSDPYRFFRITITGPNWAGSQYYNLALSQIEFFGDVTE